MALDIVWSREAEDQLDEIITYLEDQWTEREISAFFRRLEECLNLIQSAPQRQKDSLRKPGVKEFQHSPQTTIFYSYDRQKINILMIWANRKNI